MNFYDNRDNIIRITVDGELVNLNIDETNNGSIEHVELMKSDYIELHFSLSDPVIFPIGSYCNYKGKRYEVIEKQYPKISSSGLEYTLKMEAYYMKWKNIVCMYNKANGGEAGWSMTAAIDIFGNAILSVLKDAGIKYNGLDYVVSIDSTVTKEAKLVEFSQVSILEALNLIVAKDKFDCEWWMTENVIHLGKCEIDGEYTKLGDEELNSCTPNGSSSTYASKIYAFGSEKNIDDRYRKSLIFTANTINGTSLCDSNRKLKIGYFPNSSKFYSEKIDFSETKDGTLKNGKYTIISKKEISIGNAAKNVKLDLSGLGASIGTPKEDDGNIVANAVLYVTCLYDGITEEVELYSEVADINTMYQYVFFLPTSPISLNLSNDVTSLKINIEVVMLYSSQKTYTVGICGLFKLTPYVPIANSANTTVTFLSGKNKGNTYSAIFNPDGLLADNANVIKITDSITISDADTYQVNNLVRTNVPVSLFTSDDSGVKEGVIQNRLALPLKDKNGNTLNPYVCKDDLTEQERLDLNVDENEGDIEAIILFEDEYPKIESTVKNVSSKQINYTDNNNNKLDETYPQYTITLNNFSNFSNNYILDGESLKCVFQTGLLAGKEFELSHQSESTFTIVPNTDYGRQLPDNIMLPKDDDTLILFNYNTAYFDENAVSNAEFSLRDTAIKKLKEMYIDPSTYECQMNMVRARGWVSIGDSIELVKDESKIINLELGNKVNLISPVYIKSHTQDNVVWGRKSRVIGYEKAIDGTSDKYYIGESTTYSRLGSLESKIDSITYNGKTYTYSGTSTSGSSVYLITDNDNTVASDSNAFSAKRSKREFISKTSDSSTPYSLGVGTDLTVGGTTTLQEMTATSGKFSGSVSTGSLSALSATITTLSATTVTAVKFIGDLQGKLYTARSIWGQPFDGSADVTGNMTGVGSITASGKATIGGALTANGGVNTTILSTSSLATLNSAVISTNIGTSNYASRTKGWRITSDGAADFRSMYTDELRVQAFTADISQALAGSDYLTKSVSKLSANFVVPAIGSSSQIIVDDLEGTPATRCFFDGDYLRLRAINRASGFSVANVWGTVVLDTTYGTGGFLNGTQAYTFTCTATTGAGLTVFKGSEVLDYGISGNGLIARTTLDAEGSPYTQVATWVNDPSDAKNYTVHTRMGNLSGIANCNGYGFYGENTFLTKSLLVGDLAKKSNYLEYDKDKGLNVVANAFYIKTKETPIPRDLGEFDANQQYVYYDRVSHKGCLWLCILENGNTSEEPSETSTVWDKQVDKGKDAISVVVYSTDGNILKKGQPSTTLIATVFKGGEDITSTIADNFFSWVRKSANSDTDAIFNQQHVGYGKVLIVTKEDVDKRAVYNCLVNTDN
jgi:hypothetical protein